MKNSVLNTITQGWFVRPVKAEIKARDVRNCFNRERPAAFVLELEQIAPAMSEVCLEVIVTQGGPSISADNKHSMVKLSLSTDQSSSQRSSSGCSSLSGKLCVCKKITKKYILT